MTNDYGIQTLSMFKMYVHGRTLSQADGDTGDSAQRAGHFFALAKMAGINDITIRTQIGINYQDTMDAHTATDGIYVRSPDTNHWGNNPNNFSRDQWNAMQLAFAAHKDKKRLLSSFGALASRAFFHQNSHTGTDGNQAKIPDISHPTHFSVLIRGLGLGLFLFPLLLILDVFFLFDMFFRSSASDYDNMLAPQLLYAATCYPTPVSKLAMRIYLRTNFMKKLDAYHSPARNGILPFPALIWYAYKVKGFKV